MYVFNACTPKEREFNMFVAILINNPYYNRCVNINTSHELR
jgi:hypothetical protein